MSMTEVVRKRKKVEKGEGLWLFSFSDMTLILMSFFALMLSYSKIDKTKFDNVQNGMKAKNPAEREAKNLQTISEQIIKEIKTHNLDKVAQVSLDSEGLSIEFADKLVFASGSADPNADFQQVGDQVMKIIAQSTSKYNLVLEGHTDDVPLGTKAAFKTNWELSSARAQTLLEQFKKRGVSEDRMSLVSYAHTRPKVPYVGKKGGELETARTANRRVLIRIQ